MKEISISKPRSVFGRVADNTYESSVEEEFDFFEEAQDEQFHTFEPPAMAQYQPVETELQFISDHSIGENA